MFFFKRLEERNKYDSRMTPPPCVFYTLRFHALVGTHNRHYLHEYSHHQRRPLRRLLCAHCPWLPGRKGNAACAGRLCYGEHCASSSQWRIFIPAGSVAACDVRVAYFCIILQGKHTQKITFINQGKFKFPMSPHVCPLVG